ncbi:iron uptake transporter permease EfeU [Streptomyces sp. CMSTAAHL-2]|uniref:iron uptake transporter permease EfeU n=1 Tax=Streptomyces sp. CMSTAAHL-2 TaxID=2904522 RepID=UPI001E469431|nr:iron uptake transporter permease EfeU [Streptomyces sp. CMSTAAHL-2]MCE3034657.1 FTR1 family protein [Streptomyces sp. CMSTAAHL-2]
MIPTLVIGLREGLEASLIVGIIAAFLAGAGRRDALRQVWIGVVAAVLLCLAIGIGLITLSRELPQRQQEGLETVIGAFAVVMVTFMILWMNRHARGMKKELEGQAAHALAQGSARALVAMAFLAVLREGFETAVFLISVIQNSTSVTSGTTGALIGILIAVVIGYGIYRGGLRLNLGRFFKVTGLVLVLVAAGLVMTVMHTAHEAGWLNAGQAQAVDLGWLVRPGTVVSSLLTGVLGLQPQPVVAEAVAWLVYALPMLAYVAWPRRAARPAAKPAPAAAETTEHA